VGFSRTADGELRYDLPAADLNTEHIGIHCTIYNLWLFLYMDEIVSYYFILGNHSVH